VCSQRPVPLLSIKLNSFRRSLIHRLLIKLHRGITPGRWDSKTFYDHRRPWCSCLDDPNRSSLNAVYMRSVGLSGDGIGGTRLVEDR